MVERDRRAVHFFGAPSPRRATCGRALPSPVFWNLLKPNRSRRPRGSPAHCLRHQFLSGSNLTPSYRRSALRAEIIKNFPVRQNQEKPLSHRHRGPAFLAVKTGGGEIFKLLLVHTRRRSRSAECRAELWRAAESRQPPEPALGGSM